uniref:Uncharacterized protein n=1 Tax=Magallana gigas TaxID=29159 RepID=A0A8W8IXK2_MAGGI
MADDFTITETESFQYGDNEIVIMEAFNKDTCFMSKMNSGCSDQVNKRNEKGERICQSTDGGLLLSLSDTESEKYQPDSSSRRLVRHVTLTGDVIREYEFQEDGQTRLFNIPRTIKQNANTDIYR